MFTKIKDLTKNRPIIYGGTCALIGYQFGIKHQRESANRALPSGFPKTCSHEYTQQAINNITPQRHMYMEESNTNMLTNLIPGHVIYDERNSEFITFMNMIEKVTIGKRIRGLSSL